MTTPPESSGARTWTPREHCIGSHLEPSETAGDYSIIARAAATRGGEPIGNLGDLSPARARRSPNAHWSRRGHTHTGALLKSAGISTAAESRARSQRGASRARIDRCIAHGRPSPVSDAERLHQRSGFELVRAAAARNRIVAGRVPVRRAALSIAASTRPILLRGFCRARAQARRAGSPNRGRAAHPGSTMRIAWRRSRIVRCLRRGPGPRAGRSRSFTRHVRGTSGLRRARARTRIQRAARSCWSARARCRAGEGRRQSALDRTLSVLLAAFPEAAAPAAQVTGAAHNDVQRPCT